MFQIFTVLGKKECLKTSVLGANTLNLYEFADLVRVLPAFRYWSTGMAILPCTILFIIDNLAVSRRSCSDVHPSVVNMLVTLLCCLDQAVIREEPDLGSYNGR